uniref:Interleukin-3 receptor subunit alpha n=1 Tax=Ursus maritimus TaxID=29073 RepID=A0A452UY90_URSMA
MALLWLAVCLTSSVSGLLQTEEDPDSPIKNLRMEPGEKRLTWDLHGNVSEIMCFINSKFITKAINNNRYCQFQVLSSCEVKNFTVSLTKGPPFLMGIQYPLQEGNPGASAQRLDCWVHDMDFLTCSWEVGREAPSDIQYRLYRQHLWTRREQECPHYERDNRGKHVRCHFNDVPRLEKQLQILVRGTSQRATIPCSDRTVELSEIEKLNPPNITGTCNKSYSMMEWKVSSHFNRRYEYELQIQKGSDPAYTEKLQENFFALYNPGNYMARLKVKGFFRNTWSEWSAPQHFGLGSLKEEGVRTQIQTEGRPREDTGRTRGLQAKKRDLRCNQPRSRLDVRLPASRTMKPEISVVPIALSVGLGCGSPRKLTDAPQGPAVAPGSLRSLQIGAPGAPPTGRAAGKCSRSRTSD